MVAPIQDISGRGAVLSSDGKYFVTTDDRSDGSAVIRFWNTQTGIQVNTIEAAGAGWSVALSPNNHYLLNFSDPHPVVQLIDAQTGAVVHELIGNGYGVFSPDGKYVLTGGSYQSAVHLYDVSTGAEIHTFAGQQF